MLAAGRATCWSRRRAPSRRARCLLQARLLETRSRARRSSGPSALLAALLAPCVALFGAPWPGSATELLG
jgi:hypothetical protein